MQALHRQHGCHGSGRSHADLDFAATKVGDDPRARSIALGLGIGARAGSLGVTGCNVPVAVRVGLDDSTFRFVVLGMDPPPRLKSDGNAGVRHRNRAVAASGLDGGLSCASAPDFTRARSNCAATMSRVSPSISERAWRGSLDRTTSWSHVRSLIWSPGRASSSPTAASTT